MHSKSVGPTGLVQWSAGMLGLHSAIQMASSGTQTRRKGLWQQSLVCQLEFDGTLGPDQFYNRWSHRAGRLWNPECVRLGISVGDSSIVQCMIIPAETPITKDLFRDHVEQGRPAIWWGVDNAKLQHVFKHLSSDLNFATTTVHRVKIQFQYCQTCIIWRQQKLNGGR